MDETIWQPFILAVSVAPNPAAAGESVLVSVTAVDIFGAEQIETRVSGEFYAGEV